MPGSSSGSTKRLSKGDGDVGLTKAEQAKMRSFSKRGHRIAREAKSLATDVSKELKRQMKKS